MSGHGSCGTAGSRVSRVNVMLAACRVQRSTLLLARRRRPGQVRHQKLTVWVEKPCDSSEHNAQMSVMGRHDRGDSIELSEALDVLDALAGEALAGRCARVDPQRVIAKLGQTFDVTPVTAAEVEDPGTCGNRTRHDSVEGSPPLIVSHRRRR